MIVKDNLEVLSTTLYSLNGKKEFKSMAQVKKKKSKKKRIASDYRKRKKLRINCAITVLSRGVSRVSAQLN